MPGLGLSIELSSMVGGGTTASAIEDYVWDVVGGDLTPRDGIAYDFSDAWDVTSTELTPAVSAFVFSGCKSLLDIMMLSTFP